MKLNSGDLQSLLNTDSDLIEELDELETYESSKVNRTKLHIQDKMDINQRAKGMKHRESSKKLWSE